jgi:hypothetical protein
VATVLKIDTNNGNSGDVGIYYLSKETTPSSRSYNNVNNAWVYTFNGRMAYAQTTSAGALKKVSLADCTQFTRSGTVLVLSPSSISSIDIVWNGTTLVLNGTQLEPSTDAGTAIRIYAPGVTAVTLNGTSVSFTPSGNYVYAAKNKP